MAATINAGGLTVASAVAVKTLCATMHYAHDGRTLCGKKVGTMAGRGTKWFGAWPWENGGIIGTVSCRECRAKHDTLTGKSTGYDGGPKPDPMG